ncbi:hypothetical protein TrST_g1239 [Triparma strigata]|uniref:RNA polymerase II assembly factor Rtp1 C-terminal domain-containing protein n=1 Tax=Triparma strigata TaxID=1606541 RepID=A0A9W7A8G8_9STRA|nr:hypothetical protein TrST_g1239 [Triparma strigata]
MARLVCRIKWETFQLGFPNGTTPNSVAVRKRLGVKGLKILNDPTIRPNPPLTITQYKEISSTLKDLVSLPRFSSMLFSRHSTDMLLSTLLLHDGSPLTSITAAITDLLPPPLLISTLMPLLPHTSPPLTSTLSHILSYLSCTSLPIVLESLLPPNTPPASPTINMLSTRLSVSPKSLPTYHATLSSSIISLLSTSPSSLSLAVLNTLSLLVSNLPPLYISKILAPLPPPTLVLLLTRLHPTSLLPSLKKFIPEMFIFTLKLMLGSNHISAIKSDFVAGQIIFTELTEKYIGEIFGDSSVDIFGVLKVILEGGTMGVDFSGLNDTVNTEYVRMEEEGGGDDVKITCLSILNTILELGSKSRSQEEEQILKDFLPTLQALQTSKNSAILETSSHASLQILSRSEPLPPKPSSPAAKTPSSIFSEIVTLTSSTSVPTIAQGCMLLNRLLTSLSLSPSPPSSPPLPSLYSLTLKLLSHTDSYIYLSSIISLQKLIHLSPPLLLPLSSSISSPPPSSPTSKLTSAFIRSIKFNYDVMGERFNVSYSILEPVIVNFIGGVKYEKAEVREEVKGRIEEDTLKAFNDEEYNLNNSGPVYEIERRDLRRSECLLCLGELVKYVHEGIVAKVVPRIINLCVECLRMDESRVVRRGAGVMASEIFERVLEDWKEAMEGGEGKGEVLMAVVKGGGEGLKDAIKVAKGGGWGGGGGGRKGLGSGGKYYDEAVSVRCAEALKFYDEVEKLKGWEYAMRRLDIMEREERGTVGAVKRMLNASGAGEKDKDEISLKLTLNTDKLSLE